MRINPQKDTVGSIFFKTIYAKNPDPRSNTAFNFLIDNPFFLDDDLMRDDSANNQVKGSNNHWASVRGQNVFSKLRPLSIQFKSTSKRVTIPVVFSDFKDFDPEIEFLSQNNKLIIKFKSNEHFS